MRRLVTLATVCAVLLGLGAAVAAAEEGKGAAPSKTGIVKKVDVAAKQVVVMVTRELTFTVTDATKIVQGDEAKKLADIKVDAKVTVEYTREGDTRTATKITLVVEREDKK